MTLAEWQNQHSARSMYQKVRGSLSPRKRQLLAVALVRLFPIDLFEPWGLTALDAAERFAEGDLPAADFRTVADTVRAACDDLEMRQSIHADITEPAITAATMILCTCGTGDLLRSIPALLEHSVRLCQLTTRRGMKTKASEVLHHQQSNVLREIAIYPPGIYKRILKATILLPDGDEFRIHDTPRSIANVIHAEQAFDRLPILADALEDTGCSDAGLLNHLRQGSSHCRGCWALDLVLGRS